MTGQILECSRAFSLAVGSISSQGRLQVLLTPTRRTLVVVVVVDMIFGSALAPIESGGEGGMLPVWLEC
jgi:hypothetical protein